MCLANRGEERVTGQKIEWGNEIGRLRRGQAMAKSAELDFRR
jgi:hypothetical protein